MLYFLSRWGWGRGFKQMTSDLFVGHPFSSRGIKDHQCVTPLMWSKKRRRRRICRFLAQTHTWNLDPLPPSPMRADGGELSDQLLHLPHTALAPTTFIILFYCWRPLSFFFFLSPFPSLLPSLAGRIKFNCIVYDRYEVRFGTDSRQTVHRHFMVSFHLSCWCVVVTHLTKTIQDAGLVGGGTACMSTQTDTAENELRQNFLHRPIFNFQQPLTAPSSMPSSTSYYPILGQVWLVESKTVQFAAWALFFHALVCSAVVAPRWPPTHSNLIISWMGLEERCQICAICCFGVRQIEVSLENRKVWFAVSWLNKQHNVGLSGDEYNQFDLGPSVKL